MSSERPPLVVTSFGGFSIAVQEPPGAAPILSDSLGHSKKMWALIEYLLLSGKDKVPADELVELFWPGEDSSADPMNSLRLLVHRARAELDRLGCYRGSELILSGNGAYSWNRSLPVHVDAERFESLCRAAGKGPVPKRLNAMLEAVALYKGRFLPKTSYQQWALALDTYYHSEYTALCLESVELLRTLGRSRDIIELCTKAAVLDPYTEQLHVALIEALTAAGSYNEALEHYKRVTDMFLKDFGITPSEKLTAAYKTLSNHLQEMESDIGAIRETLSQDDTDGAFFCEYGLFKHIYSLKSRECIRSGETVQLALLTLLPARGRKPGARAKSAAMEHLGAVIRNSLRQGDAYTRYSVTQYLVLLQSVSYENGEAVLERIWRNYRKSVSRVDFLVRCSLLPLLPKDAEGEFVS